MAAGELACAHNSVVVRNLDTNEEQEWFLAPVDLGSALSITELAWSPDDQHLAIVTGFEWLALTILQPSTDTELPGTAIPLADDVRDALTPAW